MATLDEPPRTAQDTSYDEIYESPEFAELRSRFRRLVFPLVAAFLAWYALYVICATYAHDFMAEEVLGNINVGLVFGLLQFVSTFGIAYFYAKQAAVKIDGLGTALRDRFDGGAK
ncbi:MAG: DUF485 domain-containing protein [Sporichthyaceae bacterium]